MEFRYIIFACVSISVGAAANVAAESSRYGYDYSPDNPTGGRDHLVQGPTRGENDDTYVLSPGPDLEEEAEIEPSGHMMSFGQAVILAKEEAKCFKAYGSQQDKTAAVGAWNRALAQKIAIPHGCFVTQTSAQCEQCKNLTEKPISAPEQCQAICNENQSNSHVVPNFCNLTCLNLYFELSNNSMLYDTSHTIQERLNESEASSTSSSSSAGNKDDNILRAVQIHIRNNSQSEAQAQHQFIPKDFLHSVERLHRRKGSILQDVKVFCEGVYPEDIIKKRKEIMGTGHFIYLRWNVKSGNRTLPLIYVIEQKESNASDGEWKTIGKTTMGVQIVNVSYHSSTYRWRITAVGPEGIEDVMETEEYVTLDGYKNPGPPKQIFVADTEVRNLSVNVLIGWEPPDENTCFYKIVLEGTTGAKTKTVRISEPILVHQYWFGNLSFGKTYDVRMTSRDPSWDYFQSKHTKLEFKTPTCLESFNYRFDKCAPPPVNFADITAEIQMTKSTNIAGKQQIQVMLYWKEPPHTSDSNPIKNYLVELTPFSLNRPMNFSEKDFVPSNYTVPGNVTKLFLSNLTKDMDYTVMITAYSVRGASPQAQYRLNTKLMFTAELTNEVSGGNWVYVTVTFGVAAILLLFCNVARIYVHKRNVKIARNQYFQSMEERDESAPDWSIVPLNEDSSNWKLFDENFPKDKWEISWDDLTMAEVIGQGAFGVVRRAKVHKKKLEQKLRFRGEDESWFNSPDRNVDESDPDMETVAVKMVKVSSTRDDRDQLIKEITMMQNLGFHSQIVGLLGACTKGRTLCLVLEYCPGGDLLTFVRKVRAKYWPTLGLAANSKSSPLSDRDRRNMMAPGMKFCGSGSGGQSGRQKSVSFSSGSDNKKSSDSSPINYADIGSFSQSCSSHDGENSLSGFPEHDAGRCSGTGGNISASGGNSSKTDNSLPPFFPDQNPAEDGEEDGEEFRPIDEKDVLSYARQIAMGMEYLEKNRVVHRDLACRNVLLMGDYKHVKISDFGLSRDIYTWNVYHQKSNGKLPIKWMAIESIFTHIFTTKSDVWSYGILLWELVTLGGSPYPGLGNTELFQLLKSGYRMERPENCSQELYAVMKKCWRAAAASRPSFTELRRHIETMMEAAEPNLYLSLQADIPVDFYQLSSRADLHMVGRQDEIGCTSPLRDLSLSMSSHLNGNGVKAITGTSQSSRRKSRHSSHSHYHNTGFIAHNQNEVREREVSPASVSGGIGSWNESSANNTNPMTSPNNRVDFEQENCDNDHGNDHDEAIECSRTLLSSDNDNYEEPISPGRRIREKDCSYSKCTFLRETAVKVLHQDQNAPYSSHSENEGEGHELIERKLSAVDLELEPHSPDSGILIHNNRKRIGSGDPEEEAELNPDGHRTGENEEFYDCKAKTPSPLPKKPSHTKSYVRVAKSPSAAAVHPKKGTVPLQGPSSSTSTGVGKRPTRLTLPFINVNDMTIIENRTYDLRDS